MKVNNLPAFLTYLVLGVSLLGTISPTASAHGDGVEGDLANMGMKKLESGANPQAGLRRKTRTNTLRITAAQGTPDRIGQWSEIINTPVVPIFVSLLPNNSVLMWDSIGDLPTESYSSHISTRVAVWDLNQNTFFRRDLVGFNLFCAGFVHLADGKLFVAGGNKDSYLNGIRQTHFFDFNTNTWSRGADMAYERWYPSVAALGNGEHLIMGGGPNIHEVRQTNNTLRTLTNAALYQDRYYPFIQTSVDGRVFYAGPEAQMKMLNTLGTGAWQFFANRDNLYRSYSSYVMYDIGKVLVTGGSTPPTTSAVTIDLNSGTPQVSATSNSIYPRRQHNLTVLPDGSVLATGGLSSSASLVDLNAGVYAAELWNPTTGTWQELASAQVTRQYHSTALLLPDGRVMTGGGGICGDCTRFGYLRKDIEIFSPPYLFKPDGSGQLATRPSITNAPGTVNYSQSFTVSTPDAASIAKVSLIRLGAPTHSQDMGQRYIPVRFTVSNGQLSLTAPLNSNIAPPGYYMLFIVNSSGVPSIAKMVKVQAESNNPPNATQTFVGKLYSVHTGRCAQFNLPGFSTISLVQATCNDSEEQKFKFKLVSGTTDTYEISSVKTGRCLNPYGGYANDGNWIIQSPCNGSLSQQFRVSRNLLGFSWAAKHSNKCIHVYGNYTTEGTKIIQYSCDPPQKGQNFLPIVNNQFFIPITSP